MTTDPTDIRPKHPTLRSRKCGVCDGTGERAPTDNLHAVEHCGTCAGTGWIFVPKKKARTFKCSQCKKKVKLPKPGHVGGTGYARTDSGAKVCYACCAVIDKKYMDEHGRTALYLTYTKGQYFVSNWCGTLKFLCFYLREGSHNIARVRYDFYFRDHNGQRWYGTQYGDNTQIAHCHRYKNQIWN